MLQQPFDDMLQGRVVYFNATVEGAVVTIHGAFRKGSTELYIFPWECSANQPVVQGFTMKYGDITDITDKSWLMIIREIDYPIYWR